MSVGTYCTPIFAFCRRSRRSGTTFCLNVTHLDTSFLLPSATAPRAQIESREPDNAAQHYDASIKASIHLPRRVTEELRAVHSRQLPDRQRVVLHMAERPVGAAPARHTRSKPRTRGESPATFSHQGGMRHRVVIGILRDFTFFSPREAQNGRFRSRSIEQMPTVELRSSLS